MHRSHDIPEALKKFMDDNAQHHRPVLMDDAELGSITGGYAEDPAHDDNLGNRVIIGQTIAYFYFYEDGTEKFNAGLVTGKTGGTPYQYTLKRCGVSLENVTVPTAVWPRQILMMDAFNAN